AECWASKRSSGTPATLPPAAAGRAITRRHKGCCDSSGLRMIAPRGDAHTMRSDGPRHSGHPGTINESQIRAVLDSSGDDGIAVAPDQIAEITAEPGWLSVTLAIDTPSRELPRGT